MNSKRSVQIHALVILLGCAFAADSLSARHPLKANGTNATSASQKFLRPIGGQTNQVLKPLSFAAKKVLQPVVMMGIVGPDSESESAKEIVWREEKGGGPWSCFFAMVFVLMVGSTPVALHFGGDGAISKAAVAEAGCLYIWLIGGLYLFTNVLIFQSPHFEKPRTLCVEESVYLFAQIITTVGYGDITPAKTRGQVFIGIFILAAVMLIANMVTQLLTIFQEKMEGILESSQVEERLRQRVNGVFRRLSVTETAEVEQTKMWKALKPFFQSIAWFLCFVVLGASFFHLYPGENKTWGQAIYMSLVTLSTVGFGAFTPVTHAGMVFGAFWMLFGVGALGGVITSFSAFALAMKHHEKELASSLKSTPACSGSPRSKARRSSVPAMHVSGGGGEDDGDDGEQVMRKTATSTW